MQIDQKFWAQFATTTWEKKSAVYRNATSPHLTIDETEIFDLLVAYSGRCRRSKSADGMKLYIEGHRQFESEVLRHLPRKTDRSLRGYHERMSEQYDDYCLVCDELLLVNHAGHDALINFLALLFAEVGLPNRFAEMGLYLGNYRQTPFGVHEDPCSVFSFPVVGKKRFRTWTPEYLKRNPKLAQSFRYSSHMAGSQVLDAGVGDMTYWPSNAWHIAESYGSFSATWSLGVWVDKPTREVASGITNQVISKLVGNEGGSTMIALRPTKSGAERLPDEYLELLSILKSNPYKSLESAFREQWLVHLSKQGLKDAPKQEFVLRPNQLIRLKSVSRKIHWMKDGSDYLYAFNGALLRSARESLHKIFMKLNEGTSVRIYGKDLESLQILANVAAFTSIRI